MTKYIIIIAVLVIGGWFLIKSNKTEPQEVAPINLPANTGETTPEPTPIKTTSMNTTATLHTNKGDIKIEFFETDAPKTVANFIKLAKGGFYDGVKFHRVIKGFMDQTGDPLSKDDTKMALWGTGDPGYKFADEINAQSSLYQTGYKKGVVAMANSGPNTNGSQFFIMAVDYPLPPLYTIFGHVIAGQDVVDAINNVATGPNDRPVSAAVINSVSVQ
ncbi:MAG: peptidylprolyl isomerase [Patescibacteria group bacterium]